IAAALLSVWPNVLILLCWAHIARKFKDKKLNLGHMANVDVIESHVHALHHTVAREQFFFLWAHVRVYWADVLNEEAYAKKFGQFYVGDFAGAYWHASWFKCASGRGGVAVDSNPIENYNKGIKLTVGTSALCSSLAHFYGTSLPKIL
ncbi:hypothetical protein M885DRAFT_401240, partial [Pelagophyceae sp. CCMP2097]